MIRARVVPLCGKSYRGMSQVDNIVQVNQDLYLNISEVVRIEAHGKS